LPSAGIFNGESLNRYDLNDSKDVAARVVVKVKDTFQAGASYYDGKTGAAEVKSHHTGLEMRYENKNFMTKGEYAFGEAAGVEKNTWYLDAGYRFLKTVQGVVRYDWYDPNIKTNDDAVNEITLGVNYFIEKHNAKLQANYIFKNEETTVIKNDVFRLAMQVSF
jgi:hypothetical protein